MSIADKEFYVFADDSIVGSAVVFSFAVVRSKDVSALLWELAAVKGRYGGAASEPIHCKDLFSGQARAKTNWRHLETGRTKHLCKEIAEAVKSVGVGGTVAHMSRGSIPDRLKLVFPQGLEEESDAAELPFAKEGKQLLAFAYSAGLTALQSTFGLEKVRLYVRPDTTKIDWFKGEKRQATNAYSALAPEPKVETTIPIEFEPLLDVADILAYSYAQTLGAPRQKSKMFWLIRRRFDLAVTTFRFRPEWWDPAANAELLSRSKE